MHARDPLKSFALVEALITRLAEHAFSFDTITEAADKWQLRQQNSNRSAVRDRRHEPLRP
jgi:hypothetical protein